MSDNIKIISLNLNCFSGGRIVKKNNRQEWWKEVEKNGRKRVKDIVEYVSAYDIINFQEVNLEKEDLINDLILGLDGYQMIIPTYKNKDGFNKTMGANYSINVSFARTEFFKEGSPLISQEKSLMWSGFSDYLRFVEFVVGDLRIVNVHLPVCDKNKVEEYWKMMHEHYKMFSSSKLLYVGDFNVYKDNTLRKDLFNQLITGEYTSQEQDKAVDVWLAKGNLDETWTRRESRLDYAIASPRLYEYVAGMNINEPKINEDISDHKPIVVELHSDAIKFEAN